MARRIAVLVTTAALAFAPFAGIGQRAASACTGDVCNGICDFWNAHRHPDPRLDLHECPFR